MKMILKTPIVFVAGLLMAGGLNSATPTGVCQAQGTREWQRFTVSGEDFSVLLPIAPAMTTGEVSIDISRSRRERIIGTYADGAVYAIYTFERKSPCRTCSK